MKGSYTVEASVVVSLTMVLIMVLLYLGFLLRDRLVLYEVSLNYVNRMGQMLEEPVSAKDQLEALRLSEQNVFRSGSYKNGIHTEDMKALFIKNANEQTFLLTVRSADIQVTDRKVSLTYTAQAEMRGGKTVSKLLSRFSTVEKCVERERRMDPEEFVRLCRGTIWRK